MFTVKSLLFSPCCLPVLEDKVNTLSQFAFRCNYKSSLLLCEGEGERASSLSDGGTVDEFVGEEWGCGGRGGAHPLRPPLGIKLAQATGESIWWQ